MQQSWVHLTFVKIAAVASGGANPICFGASLTRRISSFEFSQIASVRQIRELLWSVHCRVHVQCTETRFIAICIFLTVTVQDVHMSF